MIIGSEIIFIKNLPSTNSYAINISGTKCPREGTIIQTNYQSKGRGQPGKIWESEDHKNLLFSIVLYPSLIKPQDQFVISMALSLGIIDFLSKYSVGNSIKWPNDIYVNNDKIAGILIESSIMSNEIKFLVAGIGLNINQENFPENIPNPVSLKIITGREYDLTDCLKSLASNLDERYKQLISGSYDLIKEEYISNLFRYKQWADFRDKDDNFKGRISSVTSSGGLIVEKENGKLFKYYFKEIEFIL